MSKVRIPAQLRTLTGGVGELAIDGSTVGEVLKGLDATHAGFAERIFDDEGGLRRFVNVFLDERPVPRWTGHAGHRWTDDFDRAGRRRRLTSRMVGGASRVVGWSGHGARL